ncbi:MAG TPA: DUF5071 domain-containing protein [Spirochaetota bacterium]|nr:DUF5071 domain-containing protein [Spirochaetota bacterium]HPY02770.1 DUF5071 domain-containing protein [Spirochaetota bacterium]HQA52418.1 DUF5071 domain-containing protein [Spirochaetota bacterium]
MDELKKFIPKNKFDVVSVSELSKYEYSFYKPILGNLFEWIQDINWPVAKVIIPLLIKAEKDIIPYVKDILNSNDSIWKYWVISQVVDGMDSIVKKTILIELKEDFESIIDNPTIEDKSEELDILITNLMNSIC